MKSKTLDELIQEYMRILPGFNELLSKINTADMLRYVGVKKGKPAAKGAEQLRMEDVLRQLEISLHDLKVRVTGRMGRHWSNFIGLVGDLNFTQFSIFLSVNFRVKGNKVERRLPELVLPEKITLEMIREAGREVDERRIANLPEKKVYRTNVDTIGLNMDEVEQEFGLSGAAHKSNKLPEPPEELWKPSRLYKKGVSISKSVSKGVGYGKKK